MAKDIVRLSKKEFGLLFYMLIAVISLLLSTLIILVVAVLISLVSGLDTEKFSDNYLNLGVLVLTVIFLRTIKLKRPIIKGFKQDIHLITMKLQNFFTKSRYVTPIGLKKDLVTSTAIKHNSEVNLQNNSKVSGIVKKIAKLIFALFLILIFFFILQSRGNTPPSKQNLQTAAKLQSVSSENLLVEINARRNSQGLSSLKTSQLLKKLAEFKMENFKNVIEGKVQQSKILDIVDNHKTELSTYNESISNYGSELFVSPTKTEKELVDNWVNLKSPLIEAKEPQFIGIQIKQYEIKGAMSNFFVVIYGF